MKNFTFTLMLFIGLTALGQKSGEVVFYSNANDQFFVVLNGIQQNTAPQTNVKIQGLIDPWYGCKIVSNDNIFTIEKNIMIKKDTLITYRIIEKNGTYKLRYFSETPLASAPVEATQNIVVYHATPLPVDPVVQTQTGETTVTTTTTVVQTGNSGDVIITGGSTNGGTNETVGVNMTVDENGMSVNMTVTGTGTEVQTIEDGNATISYSETTTTTTTSTGSGNGQATISSSGTQSTAPMTNCLVDGSDMEVIVKMVNDESFSDNKMRVAKQYAKKKCLTVNQIKEIAVLFSFSADQVEFVKYAYSSCINKDDYYQVMDVFTFSGDKEEISEFLDQQ